MTDTAEKERPQKRSKAAEHDELDGLPLSLALAVPYLAVGDLPALAAVSKSATKLARASLSARFRAEKPCSNDNSKKQEVLVLNEESTPYHHSIQDYQTLLHRDTPLVKLQDGTDCWKVSNRWWLKVPWDQMSSPERVDDVCHCSLVQGTLVVIVTTPQLIQQQAQRNENPHDDDDDDDDGYFEPYGGTVKTIWSIAYKVGESTTTKVDETPIVPASVQMLVSTRIGLDCGFGETCRSANGNHFAIVTEMGGSGSTRITITTYSLQLQPEQDNNQLLKVQDLHIEDGIGSEYAGVRTSLSTQGDFLCLRRTESQYLGAYWRMYDLRGPSPATQLFEHDVTMCHVGTSECPSSELVPHVFFNADDEVLLHVNTHFIGPPEQYTPKFPTVDAYVQDKLKFLRDTNSFAKRVAVMPWTVSEDDW